jgi:hypothetical protein
MTVNGKSSYVLLAVVSETVISFPSAVRTIGKCNMRIFRLLQIRLIHMILCYGDVLVLLVLGHGGRVPNHHQDLVKARRIHHPALHISRRMILKTSETQTRLILMPMQQRTGTRACSGDERRHCTENERRWKKSQGPYGRCRYSWCCL